MLPHILPSVKKPNFIAISTPTILTLKKIKVLRTWVLQKRNFVHMDGLNFSLIILLALDYLFWLLLPIDLVGAIYCLKEFYEIPPFFLLVSRVISLNLFNLCPYSFFLNVGTNLVALCWMSSSFSISFLRYSFHTGTAISCNYNQAKTAINKLN